MIRLFTFVTIVTILTLRVALVRAQAAGEVADAAKLPVRSAELRARTQASLQQHSSDVRVLFKHMRKAGGSSVRRWLDSFVRSTSVVVNVTEPYVSSTRAFNHILI